MHAVGFEAVPGHGMVKHVIKWSVAMSKEVLGIVLGLIDPSYSEGW